MSQENIEIVRSIYTDPGGLTAGASGNVAPDAEFDFTEVYPDRPILRGVEELRRFRDNGPWSGSPIHFEPERFFDVTTSGCSSSCECWPRGVRAVRKSNSCLRTNLRSAMTAWCASRHTEDATRPSNPWGSRSSRCRRRTWR